MAKFWMKANEWVQYALCGGDARFTTPPMDDESPPWSPGKVLEHGDVREIKEVCSRCRVRPECIRSSLELEMSSVWVAGEYLPDPAFKRGLRSVHDRLRGSIPGELAARGEDI